MKKHNDFLEHIDVSPELHDKIMKQVSQNSNPVYRKRAAIRYAGVAVCMAVIIWGVWFAFGFWGSGQTPGNQPELLIYEQEDRQPNTESGWPQHPQMLTAITIHHIEAAPLIEPIWNVPDPAAVQAARGANDFAFRLSAALVAGAGYDNFVVSPYSVWMPLAALLNATMYEHRPALLDAIGAGGISVEDVNRAASRMLFDLTNERARRQGWGAEFEDSPLHIANAIFVDHSRTLRHEFAQVFMDYFRGEMIQVDFLNPMAVEEVNQWASDNTNGLINEVVQEFDPNTVAAIANAIYFSGSWVNKFDPNQTQRDIFYSPAGEIYAYFMQNWWPFIPYFEDERVQAINLPFSGGSGGMQIILPKDGDAVGLLASMTSEYFDRMQNEAVFAKGRLLLPRFSIENTLNDLKDSLIALGVPLFDEAAAPLTGGLLENYLPTWASRAVQVAMVEVDEEGATAAAVTVMDVADDAGPPEAEIIFEMICNTPFVFVLHGRTFDGDRQVLFTGVVNQP